jgi:predicted patatin/cPLA2 family phospholipase
MLAVAIQGGAMRSIYCVGAVRAIVESRYHRNISSIHVASAGCVAASMLCPAIGMECSHHEIERSTKVMLARLTGKRFIDEHRYTRIVDVDYLVKTIQESSNLTPENLRAAGLVFEVALTDSQTGSAIYVDLARCSGQRDLTDALRATMAIPVLYPPKAIFDGRRYFDGGIADPLPLFRAASTRPAAILSVASVAAGTLADPAAGRERNILRIAPGIPSIARSLMLTRNPLADATETFIRAGAIGDIPIISITPSRPELLGHRLETDPAKLLMLEQLGYEDGRFALRERDTVLAQACRSGT